jgi:hypothetical protein
MRPRRQPQRMAVVQEQIDTRSEAVFSSPSAVYACIADGRTGTGTSRYWAMGNGADRGRGLRRLGVVVDGCPRPSGSSAWRPSLARAYH